MYNMVLTSPFILREPSNPILGTASLFLTLNVKDKKREAVPRIGFEGSLNINGEVNTMLYMKCNHQIPSQLLFSMVAHRKKIVTVEKRVCQEAPRFAADCRKTGLVPSPPPTMLANYTSLQVLKLTIYIL